MNYSLLRLRSVLLKPLPYIATWSDRLPELLRRWLCLGIVVAISIALILITHFHQLPRNGIAYPLYALHDRLFLWLKGNTLIRAFPFSLVWWGILLTIAALILASWSVGRSFILSAHARVLTALIREPRWHWLLVQTAARLSRARWIPRLVRAVADYERETAVINLIRYDLYSAPDYLARRLTVTGLFSARLERYFQPDPLHVLARWHQELVLILAYTPMDKRRVQTALNEMMRIYTLLRLPVPNPMNVIPPDQVFSEQRLILDIIDLLVLTKAHLDWLRLPKEVDLDELRMLDTESAPVAVIRLEDRLLFSIDKRREVLDATSAILQAEVLGRSGLVTAASPAPLPTLSGVQKPADAGRLALTIVLHYLLLIDQPAVARATIEALESVALLTSAIERRTPDVAVFAALTGVGEYSEEDAVDIGELMSFANAYRIVALISDSDLIDEADAWEVELSRSDYQADAVVQRSDFRMEQDVIASWLTAADLGLSQPEPESEPPDFGEEVALASDEETQAS